MPWTTIHLRVTTPLFNGGADARPDADTGLRVSSLRGAMRFWFRALAGIGIGNDTGALARLERRIFGATDRASPVKLRLPDPPAPISEARPGWCNNRDSRWIIYLLGQGHGNLGGREPSITKPFVPPGTDIRLQARLGDDDLIASAVLASLWALCAYGGVGARTRRGFGGLRIVDVDGDLPAPWTPDTLRSPELDFYDRMDKLWPAGPIGPCAIQIKDIAERDCRDDPPIPFRLVSETAPAPVYPAFSKQHTIAGLSGGDPFDSWNELLAYAGEQFRYFRARRSTPETQYHPAVKTPEWLDVVHGDRSSFGLGALGLPVVYKGYVVNAFDQDAELRRASPLWLRPVGQDREWRLLSYAFHGTFLPDSARVEVRKDQRRFKDVVVTREDVVQRTREWIHTLAADKHFRDKLQSGGGAGAPKRR